MILFIAPSGPPTYLASGTSTHDSISVSWGEVTCVDRNGDVTGYKLRITRTGQDERIVDVNGDQREATLSGVAPSSNYSVRVAAVNGAGTGPYGDEITVQTEQCESVIIPSFKTHSFYK